MKIDQTKVEIIEMIKQCDSLEELMAVLYTSQNITSGILVDMK